MIIKNTLFCFAPLFFIWYLNIIRIDSEEARELWNAMNILPIHK